MSVTKVSYKTKPEISVLTIFTHLNAWTLVKLFLYSFSFFRICTFTKDTCSYCNTVNIIKGNEKLEHILNTGMFCDRKKHLSHFHDFIHSFTLCAFQVKYSVSQLFLLFVLSARMNVLILNWKLHTNKPQ